MKTKTHLDRDHIGCINRTFTMTNKEIISYFKKAEKYFNTHQDSGIGLCHYFRFELGLKFNELKKLEKKWYPYKTNFYLGTAADFNNQEERLEAIRKVINEHENKKEMNTLHWMAIALFASAFVSGLLLFMTATFLLFTAGVLVLAIAIYVKDRAESGS